MPGPVSDSYDPEFGTRANASDVSLAIKGAVEDIEKILGSELKNIVQVVQGEPGKIFTVKYSERDLRTIRFALNRAIESI